MTPIPDAKRLFGLRESIVGQPFAAIRELQFEEGGFGSAFDALQATGAGITALFCAHDGIGVHVISELHRIGRRVPQDISVVGYGDFSAASQISPQLTTVRLPGEDMGVAAFRLLLERLDTAERPLPFQRLMLVPRLIERDSVSMKRG